ncbi:hypothetical protein C4D00_RS24585, partial [Vibrio parahaemolyticus]|nr:hypothetical protein [Vibrio parahaemolyticus]EJG0454826.1 hypothetical protein [Vibrio parahaemolyticus]EKN4680997.1 hypothetical protein [Vibrio parahaemolyticus]EKQ3541436.1 hypothetical protein [Vibrio parahaemolyticus]
IMANLYSIFELKHSISVDRTALGKSYPIKLGGVNGVIHMPHLPNWAEDESDPLWKLLTPPEPAIGWKQGAEPIFWGRPNRYPCGHSSVHKILLQFHANDAEVDGKLIYEAFVSWLNLLLDYLEVMSNQNVRIEQTLNSYGDNFHLFQWDENGKKQGISENKLITICLDNWQKNITHAQFLEACSLASSGAPLKLTYKLYLEANRAFLQKDYRKTVIECGAAIENALTELISLELSTRGLSDEEIGLRLSHPSNKTLGGRFNLADSQLHLNLLQQEYRYRELLVEPRNNAVHEAEFVSQQVARKAIDYTCKLLAQIAPQLQET